MIGTTENYKVNQHAMKQRIEGKTFREIGEELGVGVERARQRVAWGFRHAEKYERDKNSKIVGDLFLSERLRNVIKGIPADHMTFNEFLDTNQSTKPNGHTKCWKNVRQRIGQCLSEKRSFGKKNKSVAQRESKKSKKKTM